MRSTCIPNPSSRSSIANGCPRPYGLELFCVSLEDHSGCTNWRTARVTSAVLMPVRVASDTRLLFKSLKSCAKAFLELLNLEILNQVLRNAFDPQRSYIQISAKAGIERHARSLNQREILPNVEQARVKADIARPSLMSPALKSNVTAEW
jgi:hypothetical protein